MRRLFICSGLILGNALSIVALLTSWTWLWSNRWPTRSEVVFFAATAQVLFIMWRFVGKVITREAAAGWLAATPVLALLGFFVGDAMRVEGNLNGANVIYYQGLFWASVWIGELWERAWPPPDAPDLRQVKAQLRTLENQIQPHFFHNTLNTIAALIRTDPAKAEQTVRNLSDLYRLVMQTNAPQVPLAQELDFVERYLAIEAARFGDRLTYHLPTPALAHNLELPPLTLQPVIENAIKHGIAKRIAGGRVEVALNRAEKTYTLRVTSPSEDDAPPVKEFFPKGHALAITRERLHLQYGEKTQMQALQQNGFTEVSITLPA